MGDSNFPTYGCGEAVDGRWQIDRKLGEGGFGVVYLVSDLYDPAQQKYAMKMEYRSVSKNLKQEVYVMKLALMNNCKHFCRYMGSGLTAEHGPDKVACYMTMTLIGETLEDKKNQARLTLGCALAVGKQCLTAIEELHSIGFLHRDLKPENFAVSKMDETRVILFDFGLSRQYVDDRGRIRLPRYAVGFRGTQRYAPLSCHLRRESCRKDDLEIWLYQQVELTKGTLPWRNVEGQQFKDQVGMFKERCRYGVGLELFLGGCPRQYVEIMRYIDGLGYYDDPNYNKIHNLLTMAMQTHKVFETYDWVERTKQQSSQKMKAQDA